MRKFIVNKRMLLLVAGSLLLALILLLSPSLQRRLSWRVEAARTYLRGVISPVKPLPTALLLAHLSVVTMTPSTEPTAAVTATPTATLAVTPTITPTPTPLPAQVRLSPPPHEVQDINNCGPATLSMYLHYYGWEGDQFSISEIVKPIRQDRNVNIDELVMIAREKAGWLTSDFRVGGTLSQLRRLIAAGIPVMIEEGFTMAESYWPNDDRWSGHYLLVTGYDDERQIFYSQDSFVGPDRIVEYDELDHNWQAFNRAYILVFPPEKLGEVQSILGDDWDAELNRSRALETARLETETDPENAFTWFNLGSNLVYFEKYSEAAQAYDQARNLNLPQRMLRYQFGPFFAYFNTNRWEEMLALTEYALERTPNSEEALLWNGWANYRLGKRNEAVESFQKALEARAGYGDALYALDFVLNN